LIHGKTIWKVLTYKEFRQNLAKSLDKVSDGAEIVIVSRSNGTNVVVMDLNEYNSIAADKGMSSHPI
jgi:antitoxin YefM